MSDILYIVIPCYNEEDVLPETAKTLKLKLENLIKEQKIGENSRVIFINDGSTDKTWELITQLHDSCKLFSGVKLSRNRGEQNAFLAGLMVAKDKADFIISMDADLQDDVNAMDEMIDKYLHGSDIVYGVRSSRAEDSFFKKFTAETYYKLLSSMGADIVFNHADYRLMSKRALEALSQFKEKNLFLRGMIPMLGFKSDIVYYERHARAEGESKYPLKKMIALASDGITSFSSKPLRYITALGIIIFLISICLFIFFIYHHVKSSPVSVWLGVISSVWAVGGLVLLSLGIIGEYIGKIYLESKDRPNYIVETVLDDKE